MKSFLSPKMCELVGAFIGDGYMGRYGSRKNQYLVGFAGDIRLDRLYFRDYLLPIIKENFALSNPALRYRKDERTIMLRVYSKDFYCFLHKLGFLPGKKSASVVIPDIIYSDDRLLKHTIRGIFDTDGCIFLDRRKSYGKPYPRITLQSASIGLIDQMERFLSRSFTLYVNKKNRDGYRNYIEIYGHKQLEKFLNEIGFSNQRHLKKVPL